MRPSLADLNIFQYRVGQIEHFKRDGIVVDMVHLETGFLENIEILFIIRAHDDIYFSVLKRNSRCRLIFNDIKY